MSFTYETKRYCAPRPLPPGTDLLDIRLGISWSMKPVFKISFEIVAFQAHEHSET